MRLIRLASVTDFTRNLVSSYLENYRSILRNIVELNSEFYIRGGVFSQHETSRDTVFNENIVLYFCFMPSNPAFVQSRRLKHWNNVKCSTDLFDKISGHIERRQHTLN